jgi:hypothetical protein
MDLSKLIVEGFGVKAIRAKLVEMDLVFEKAERSLVLIERFLIVRSSDSQRLEWPAHRSVDPVEGGGAFRQSGGYGTGAQRLEATRDIRRSFRAHLQDGRRRT